MKKLVMLGAMGIAVAVVGAEEPKFDRKVWDGIENRAREQSEKEFSKEFVIEYDSPVQWESGKGVSYFREHGLAGIWMKVGADGRIVKISAETNFPELVRLNTRKVELEKQMREEYAKSLGVTVGDIQKVVNPLRRIISRSSNPKQRPNISEAMKKRVEEQRKKYEDEQNRLNAELQKVKEERLQKEANPDAQK